MNKKDDLLIQAYVVLADPKNLFPDRHTPYGQKLLCDLRDELVEITGLSAEEVQNFDFLENHDE